MDSNKCRYLCNINELSYICITTSYVSKREGKTFFTKNIVVLQRPLIRKLVASYSWSWRKKKKALISYFCSCCCDLDNLNPSVCVQYPVSIIKKENQEGIQQLRGPNLTQF